jgi:hypothetical protein
MGIDTPTNNNDGHFRDPTDDDDYTSTIAIIETSRLLKRYAFCAFGVPMFVLGIVYVVGVRGQAIAWVGFLLYLPSLLVFAKLRVPTPRIPWRDDFRGPLLVLRSFADERLKTGEMLMPGDFDPSPAARDNYAWQAALTLWDVARVVMIQTEHETVTPIYGIVIKASNDTWRDDVKKAATGAWAILLFPSPSPGVVEEMSLLRDIDCLWKTVIFMPPTPTTRQRLFLGMLGGWYSVDHRSGWGHVRTELAQHGFCLPDYEAEGMLFVPDEKYGIDRALRLNHNEYPWRRIPELIDPSSAHAEGLIDCLPASRSYEMASAR